MHKTNLYFGNLPTFVREGAPAGLVAPRDLRPPVDILFIHSQNPH